MLGSEGAEDGGEDPLERNWLLDWPLREMCALN